ncbi:LysM peptidoglycan-binding domain-containing protein [Streptomyces sp. MBT65]|uniref:LysM peptidoglycan-binding domain-containing protein n=1 Tax=Streptomyces sp. MBT65 TaxID=1488395 RepID=UPI00190AB4A2|nr:transglycosylase family protein [Streptomyces sp. MBT65]MBK3581231.1 LysM peptidoglycan-binding domain-containing protein [Streptomyces sp. MBT65]
MLSGNGRHRRPRQAPALLVAAGVTGSAIAIPLLGAAAANAADGTTWDKVAECESGGSWSENSGNGYYGGLQMSQDEWDKYGGSDYAPSADLASRSQQIAVAEKVLDDKGTSAWTTCALIAGLTTDSGSTNVDTGLASDSPSAGATDPSDSGSDSGSSDSSVSSGLSDSGTTDSSSSDASGDSGDDSSSSPSPTATDNPAKSDKSTTPSTGNGSVAASPKLDESDNSAQAVGKSSLVDTGALDDSTSGTSGTSGGKHRGASAEESVTPQTYTVRAGDSLASIANSLGFDGGWRALYAENKKVIGADPTQIAAGQTLDVGTEADEK